MYRRKLKPFDVTSSTVSAPGLFFCRLKHGAFETRLEGENIMNYNYVLSNCDWMYIKNQVEHRLIGGEANETKTLWWLVDYALNPCRNNDEKDFCLSLAEILGTSGKESLLKRLNRI